MSPSRILPLLVIVPIVAAAVRWGRPHYLDSSVSALVFSLLCAGVLGLPALYWALDHESTAPAFVAALGAAAGSLAPFAVLAAGLLGQLQHGGATYMRRVIEHGATLPWYGMVPWMRFAGLVASSAIVGGVSAGVYWALVLDRRRSRIVSILISMGLVGAGAGLAMLLP